MGLDLLKTTSSNGTPLLDEWDEEILPLLEGEVASELEEEEEEDEDEEGDWLSAMYLLRRMPSSVEGGSPPYETRSSALYSGSAPYGIVYSPDRSALAPTRSP